MYTFLLEKRKTKRATLDIALLFISLFWISKGRYLVALLLILVALVGFYINRKKVVVVSANGIRYPYFIDKVINWQEVENIKLRDDILTIDLKSNKLLQSMVLPNEQLISESAFNDYCLQQLTAARSESLLNEKL